SLARDYGWTLYLRRYVVDPALGAPRMLAKLYGRDAARRAEKFESNGYLANSRQHIHKGKHRLISYRHQPAILTRATQLAPTGHPHAGGRTPSNRTTQLSRSGRPGYSPSRPPTVCGNPFSFSGSTTELICNILSSSDETSKTRQDTSFPLP